MHPSAASIPARPRNEKTRKKLAPAFVMTVALLVVPQGCGGNVDDGSGPGSSGAGGSGASTSKGGSGGSGGSVSKGGSGGTGSNRVDCPVTQPFSGSCEGIGKCSYPNGSCGSTTSECVGGKWVGNGISCNPPPPPCPSGEIVEGAGCPGGGFGNTSCPRVVDGCDVTFECQGTWKKRHDSCATCPASLPAQNGSCPRPGLACQYSQANGLCEDARCTAGAWQVGSCPEPPPPCPAEPPPANAHCTAGPASSDCSYSVNGCTEHYVCAASVWTPSMKVCDEPAMPACQAAIDQESCAGAGCRWLWPGCASDEQTKLGKPGCFAPQDCKLDAACVIAGTTCKTVVTDPCHDSNCDACGQETRVCL